MTSQLAQRIPCSGPAGSTDLESSGGSVARHMHGERRVLRSSDGVNLAVTDYGPRTAGSPTVVFLHGLCLSQMSWVRHIQLLCHTGAVRVVSYDHRGHGRSGQAPVSSYRPDQLADDLAHILASLKLSGPLVLVGHSLGAMVALSYLARSNDHRPVDPDGLVLVATAAGRIAERGLGRLLATPGIESMCRAGGHIPDRALRAAASPVCAAVSRWVGFTPGQRATTAALVASAIKTTPVMTALGFLPGLRTFDAYRVLAQIRARTVIISGEADVVTPVDHSRELATAIPGAELISLPAVGHMIPQQAPHIIDRAIRSLLVGPTAPSASRTYCVSDQRISEIHTCGRRHASI